MTSFKLDERRVRRRQVLRTAVDDCISELETQGACFSGWRRGAAAALGAAGPDPESAYSTTIFRYKLRLEPQRG